MTDSSPAYALGAETETALRRTAHAFRVAAANPTATTMPAKWVEGFSDGLRFAAAALDELAGGTPSADGIAAALGADHD